MIIPSLDGQSVSLLGLGDIAVPGLLISFLYRQGFPRARNYFNISLIGYSIGLLITMCVSILWNHPQPALLFLVPSTLLSILLPALLYGDLRLIWNSTDDCEKQLGKFPAIHDV